MPSCPYFILSTPLSLNKWTHFLISASAWGQARSKLGGVDTSILHHAFISIFIALGLLLHIMSQYLCLFSLILQGLHEEGECGSSDSGMEKEKILETYSAQLQKSWNFTGVISRIYKKYWAQEVPEGVTHQPRGWGRALPPRRGPCLVGPLVALRCPSSAIWSLSWRKKS